MTIKEQETYYSVHYRSDGKPICGHRNPQKLASNKSFVTCPWCKYEIEQENHSSKGDNNE